MVQLPFPRTKVFTKLAVKAARVAIGCALLLAVMGWWPSTSHPESPQSIDSVKKVTDVLSFPFDGGEPMGSAKNPAVILPASSAALIGDLPAARRAGDVLLVPVAELQKAVNQPLIGTVLTPLIGRITNVKSFDGFSAIDGLSTTSNYTSFLNLPNKAARKLSGEDFEKTRSLLRDGDLIFGSHVFNLMTWGRYVHVGIVSNADQGKILEATANGPSDKPGVQETDWKNYAATYGHTGIVRVRGASPQQLRAVIQWIEARKGRPYRWPILMGLDNNDESRFYCSQLLWRAFKQVMNIDLDVDKGALIFPDDLYHSKDHVDIIVP